MTTPINNSAQPIPNQNQKPSTPDEALDAISNTRKWELVRGMMRQLENDKINQLADNVKSIRI